MADGIVTFWSKKNVYSEANDSYLLTLHLYLIPIILIGSFPFEKYTQNFVRYSFIECVRFIRNDRETTHTTSKKSMMHTC